MSTGEVRDLYRVLCGVPVSEEVVQVAVPDPPLPELSPHDPCLTSSVLFVHPSRVPTLTQTHSSGVSTRVSFVPPRPVDRGPGQLFQEGRRPET